MVSFVPKTGIVLADVASLMLAEMLESNVESDAMTVDSGCFFVTITFI